jgi:hypothetical protein
MKAANALLNVPKGTGAIKAGSMVKALLMRSPIFNPHLKALSTSQPIEVNHPMTKLRFGLLTISDRVGHIFDH